MTTTEFHALAAATGCRSVREFSRLMLGEEWTPGLYNSLNRQLAEGELTGWPAALAEKTAELHALPAEAVEEPERAAGE